jgi:hypothetical protein
MKENGMKDKHKARPERIGTADVPGILRPVAVWGDVCLDCGKGVRRMTGHGRGPGGDGFVFWHAAAKPGPEDPRRQKPRRADWSEAISQGMKAATARRKAEKEARG